MSKLVSCRSCGKEVAKGAKCLSCGKDQRNFFQKHKILTGIAVIVVIGVIGSATNKGGTTTTATTVGNSSRTATTSAITPTVKAIAKRQVVGTATDLGTGTFTGGTDIKAGLYDVTPVDGSGNFNIIASAGMPNTNDILGVASMGVSEVRAKISNGDKIQLQGINKTHFQPVATPFVTTVKTVVLNSGDWVVGQDIVAGRYEATPTSGSGNFEVSTNGITTTNEILGVASMGVKEVAVDLNNGDIISISGINKTTLTPVK